MFGRTLRRLRKQGNFTIVALAKKAGIDKNTIVRLEQGRGNPSFNTLTKLSEALGVSPEQLITLKIMSGIDYVTFKPQSGEDNASSSAIHLPSGALNTKIINLPPGKTSQTKSHQGEELIFCLTGKLTVKIGKAIITLTKGCSVTLFAGNEHSYVNPNQSPATALIVWTKATIEEQTAHFK